MINKQLDTNIDLKGLYLKANREYFNGESPKDLEVEWSNRMTTCAGRCFSKRIGSELKPYRIRMSRKYHDIHQDEILDTLVHEMIHVQHPKDGHGSKFKNRCLQLNKSVGFNLGVYGRFTPQLERPYKYNYQCLKCGQSHRYKNRNRRYDECLCGRCSGSLREILI